MKISDLMESIKLSRFQPEIYNLIYDVFDRAIKIGGMEVESDYDMYDQIGAFKAALNGEVEAGLKKFLPKKLSEYVGIDIKVVIKSIEAAGSNFKNVIVLSTDIIHAATTVIIELYTKKALQGDLKSMLLDPADRETVLRYIDDHISSITEIVIHEAAHAKQYASQRDHDRHEYTSYLEPYREKFYAILNNYQKNGEGIGYYLSSPQEIGAFATQNATAIVRELSELPVWDQPELLDKAKRFFMGELKNRSENLYRNIKDSDNPVLQKSYRRFLKMTYIDIDDAIDPRIKELKAGIDATI